MCTRSCEAGSFLGADGACTPYKVCPTGFEEVDAGTAATDRTCGGFVALTGTAGPADELTEHQGTSSTDEWVNTTDDCRAACQADERCNTFRLSGDGEGHYKCAFFRQPFHDDSTEWTKSYTYRVE